jgi:putative DNA primase/helicase
VSNILYDKLQTLGIPSPPEEVTETKVTRWGHNKRYWAVRFTGGYAIGDWASNLREFAFEEGFSYAKCKQQIAEAQRKLTQKRNEDNAVASVQAKQIWNAATNCTTHPYLETKKIKAHGLKIDRQTLLIPLQDERGNLTSLQKIWPNPQISGKFVKGFLKGSRIQGCFFLLGLIKDEVVICEGYATGATIHEITKLPVVVAFSSNNLQQVACLISKKYPNTKITVAADNDRFKSENPGLAKAKEAAAAVKARLVVPEFANDEGELTDFNDLYVNEGVEKVSEAFLAKKCNLEYMENAEKGTEKGAKLTRIQFMSGPNEVQTIFYNQKNVRTLKMEGKTLWILKDVCNALGLSDTNKVGTRLDKDELKRIQFVSGGQSREMYAVTEAGLYATVLHSRKPEARKFERWITHEVLPQIREYGAYTPSEATKTTLSPPENVQELTQTAGEIEETKEKDTSAEINTPDGFMLTKDILSYYDESKKDYAVISGHIEVIAHTEDHGSEQTGKLVKFLTRSGEIKQLRLHNNMIIKDGDAIHQILAAKGLFVSTRKRAKNKLSEYINACNPKQHAKIIKVTGWIDNCYITENGIIGENPDELLIFQTDAEPTAVGSKGDLQDWIENIGRLCTGNSRLVLAVSAAFASILLKPCKRENFGIHFVGSSSEGKSTALYVAASVFGSRKYLRSWRSTDNGLEGIAATHNDMLLILDELGASDPKKAGDISYMFNSGQGKTRANTTGAVRKPYTWRIGVLSSGEKDLETHMAEANKRMYTGQSIRLITVFAKPTPESTGLLEKLNGFSTYSALAQHFDKTTQECYGTPMVTFVENVIKETNSMRKYFDTALREAKMKHLPGGANGQDDRVFKFFFTIGFAGELATRYDITGWPAGEALTAAIEEYSRWISHKGGYGNQEEKQMLEQIKHFFATYSQSKFQKIVNGKTFDPAYLNERAGFTEERTNTNGSKEDVFYVFPEYFKNVIARGLSLKLLCKLLTELGILETKQDEDRSTTVIKLNGKPYRMYVINSKIFE